MTITFVSLAILCALLILDLVTKALAAAANVNVDVWIFGLRYTQNKGIAFGLFESNANAMVIITAFTIVLILLIGVMFFTMFKKNKPAQIALAVIEAGALGNLIDRLCLGYVRDFIDVSFFGFGVCNIADFCVTFGAVALVIIILFIGPASLIPLKKEWREEAKAIRLKEEEEERKAKAEKEAREAQELENLSEVKEIRKDLSGDDSPKDDE